MDALPNQGDLLTIDSRSTCTYHCHDLYVVESTQLFKLVASYRYRTQLLDYSTVNNTTAKHGFS